MTQVKLVKKKSWVEVNIRDTTLSKNETKCNEFFKHWKTIGCFISKVLPCVAYCELKCDNYKILVAASSIIRPGVAQSGMMKEYILDTTPISSNIFMKHSKNIWEKPMVLWCIRKM
jgi:DNA polymerase-3 subunit alpha